MSPADRNYLQSVLDAFIDASIQRVSHSGVLAHRYRLSGAEFRTGTKRQRLHDSVTNDVIAFFRNANTEATYEGDFDNFNIVVDLNHCLLNRGQAEFLSVAMTNFCEDL